MDAHTLPSPPDRIDPSKTPEQFVILPSEIRDGWMSISTYQQIAKTTDKLPDQGLELTVLGLFGEVGSLLSAFKKRQRDRAAFKRYNATILEELGDTLWYFSTLASRAHIDLSTIAQLAFRKLADWSSVKPADPSLGFADVQSRQGHAVPEESFSAQVLDLAGCVGDLLNDFKTGIFDHNRDKLSAHMVEIFRALVAATQPMSTWVRLRLRTSKRLLVDGLRRQPTRHASIPICPKMNDYLLGWSSTLRKRRQARSNTSFRSATRSSLAIA